MGRGIQAVSEARFSSGPVAKMLGVERDDIQSAHRSGAPEPGLRVAGKRVYSEDDVLALRRWFQARGKRVNDVKFDKLATA